METTDFASAEYDAQHLPDGLGADSEFARALPIEPNLHFLQSALLGGVHFLDHRTGAEPALGLQNQLVERLGVVAVEIHPHPVGGVHAAHPPQADPGARNDRQFFTDLVADLGGFAGHQTGLVEVNLGEGAAVVVEAVHVLDLPERLVVKQVGLDRVDVGLLDDGVVVVFGELVLDAQVAHLLGLGRVVRQHLERDSRQNDDRQNAQGREGAVAHGPVEGAAVTPCQRGPGGFDLGRTDLDEAGHGERDESQRDEQGTTQGDDDGDAHLRQPGRELALPAEDEGDEDDDRGQRRGHDRHDHFAGAHPGRLHPGLAFLDVAEDRFQGHDGVVHQHAGGKHQPHHRQHVERPARQVEDSHRGDD